MAGITITKADKTQKVEKGIILRLQKEKMELNITFVGYETNREMAEELAVALGMSAFALGMSAFAQKEGGNVC